MPTRREIRYRPLFIVQFFRRSLSLYVYITRHVYVYKPALANFGATRALSCIQHRPRGAGSIAFPARIRALQRTYMCKYIGRGHAMQGALGPGGLFFFLREKRERVTYRLLVEKFARYTCD